MKPKCYAGQRTPHGCKVMVWTGQPPDCIGHALDPRTDLHNHSCGQFEWGYVGSGPAQLALALLADALGDDREALARHQHLVQSYVSRLGGDTWTVGGWAILMLADCAEPPKWMPDRLYSP